MGEQQLVPVFDPESKRLGKERLGKVRGQPHHPSLVTKRLTVRRLR